MATKLLLNKFCHAQIDALNVPARSTEMSLFCLQIDKGDYDQPKNYKVREVMQYLKGSLGGPKNLRIDNKQCLVYWLLPTKQVYGGPKRSAPKDQENEEMAVERFIAFLTGKSRGRVLPDTTLTVSKIS